MRMRALLSCVFCAGLVAVGLSSWLAQADAPPDTADRSQAKDPNQFKATAETLLAAADDARAAAMTRFVQAIELDSSDHVMTPTSQKALALIALARLRAREAMPLLVREINYLVTVSLSASPIDGRLGVQALIRCGLPAAEAVLAPKVLDGADERTVYNIAMVVRYVFPSRETAEAFVEAHDPGYSEAGRANRAAVQGFIATLPRLRVDR